jgi:hypothetical protein
MRGPPGPSAEDLEVLPELDRRWAGIFGAAATGELDTARDLIRPLLQEEPRWGDFVQSLADLELLPNAAELLDA